MTAPPDTRSSTGGIERLERASRALSAIRNILISVAALALILGFVAGFAIELSRDEFLIEPIALPKAVSDRGYSPEVAAHRIMDAIEAIQQEATTFKVRGEVLPESRVIDLAVPGVELSLKSIVRYMRAFFGLPETRIAGEFVCGDANCGREQMSLRLRVWQDEVRIIRLEALGNDSEDSYFAQAAEKVLLHTDPFVIASLYYRKDEARALGIAQQLIREDHRDKRWALNLIGLIHYNDDGFEAALAWYKKATEVDPDFAIAYSNWGNALSALGNHGGAVEKYRKAVALDPDYATAYLNWGAVLAKQDDNAGAIDKFQRAIDIKPNYATAYANWGSALAKLGDYSGAIEKYQAAVAIDPTYVMTPQNFGSLQTIMGGTR